jgi:hypothetical protein
MPITGTLLALVVVLLAWMVVSMLIRKRRGEMHVTSETARRA